MSEESFVERKGKLIKLDFMFSEVNFDLENLKFPSNWRRNDELNLVQDGMLTYITKYFLLDNPFEVLKTDPLLSWFQIIWLDNITIQKPFEMEPYSSNLRNEGKIYSKCLTFSIFTIISLIFSLVHTHTETVLLSLTWI